MISEAACEEIESVSIRSSTARIACTFSCRVLRREGVLQRMLILSEMETARTAGTLLRKRKKCR